MQTLTKNIKQSWHSLKDYRKWIVLTVIVDLLALIGFTKVYIYVWENAMVHLEAVSEAFSGGAITDVSELAAKSAEFTVHQEALMKFAWIFLISLVVIWAVSQGINWFICSKIAMRKKINMDHFTEHMIKFSVLTVVWTIVFVLITALSVKMGVSFMRMLGSTNEIIIAILFVLLCYFEFVSYAIIPKYRLGEIIQKTFKTGGIYLKQTIPLYLSAIILIAVLSFIMVKIWAINEIWSLVFFVMIMLPAFAYLRILFVRTMEKLKA